MLRKYEFLVSLLFISTAANATLLVNAPEPHPQYTFGATGIVIDYAGNSTGTLPVGATMNPVQGYRTTIINTATVSSNNDLVYLDISSDASFNSTGKVLGVSVVNGLTDAEVTLTGASVASGTNAPTPCNAGGNCFSDSKAAVFSQGNTLRVSFSISGLCNGSTSGDLCAAASTLAGQRKSQSIRVYLAVVNDAISGFNVKSVAAATGTAETPLTFNLQISDLVPDLSGTATCPSNYYFPGDSSIYFYPGTFTASANGGSDLRYYVVLGAKSPSVPTAPASMSSNSIVSFPAVASSSEIITGFENTTNGTDNEYNLHVYLQNRAGIISSTSVTNCTARSQAIQGILKESKCFIATAAYHDGRAAPVMMLRRFRDRVLSRFDSGRKFIDGYYRVSPALAEWAWDKPIIRSIALKVLTPIELMAWVMLQFSEANAATEATQDSPQPYIDRVKKQIGEQPEDTTSYTEQIKSQLKPESAKASESYIDRVKKKLSEEKQPDSSVNYSEIEKAKLAPEAERESPIQVVKDGRDDRLGWGKTPNISHAAGMKLGVSQGMQVEVEGGIHTFEEVYGSGYQPELLFHYEYQIFHSENLGSLGAGLDFGVAYAGGKGLLQFNAPGSSTNESKTGFSFFQIPTIVNAVYRFNLLRLIRPYASVGAGSIFYTETREDNVSDKRGVTAVFQGSVGASLAMNWMDPKTSRDAYLADGIQHTFFFLEYLYLNSFKSAVTFKRAGLYAGFLFEF